MYRHILVATDGSTLSLKAIRAAARLGAELKSHITAVYVIAPFSPPRTVSAATAHGYAYSAQDYARDARKSAEKALRKTAAVAGGTKVSPVSVVHPRPWEAIIATARKKKCDLIVMASHGRRGLAGLLLGSETQKVLTHSKTPVLVCR